MQRQERSPTRRSGTTRRLSVYLRFSSRQLDFEHGIFASPSRIRIEIDGLTFRTSSIVQITNKNNTLRANGRYNVNGIVFDALGPDALPSWSTEASITSEIKFTGGESGSVVPWTTTMNVWLRGREGSQPTVCKALLCRRGESNGCAMRARRAAGCPKRMLESSPVAAVRFQRASGFCEPRSQPRHIRQRDNAV